jgi:hypothetical protein
VEMEFWLYPQDHKLEIDWNLWWKQYIDVRTIHSKDNLQIMWKLLNYWRQLRRGELWNMTNMTGCIPRIPSVYYMSACVSEIFASCDIVRR